MIVSKLLVLNFLVAMQGVESNNGLNTQHKLITASNSLHLGDTAIGRWGLMPNTIRLLKRDPEKVKFNKEYEFQVAYSYAYKILNITKGNPYKASVLWLRGHSAVLKPADYKTPRFNKFKLIYDSL